MSDTLNNPNSYDVESPDQAVWFYESRGRNCGPITSNGLKRLLHLKFISGNSLVWTKDFGASWKRLSDTHLMDFSASAPNNEAYTGDVYGYILAAYPLIYAIFYIYFRENSSTYSISLFLDFFSTTIFMLILLSDAISISNGGRHINLRRIFIFGWITPIYLFQRGQLAEKNFTLFFANILAIIIAALMFYYHT